MRGTILSTQASLANVVASTSSFHLSGQQTSTLAFRSCGGIGCADLMIELSGRRSRSAAVISSLPPAQQVTRDSGWAGLSLGADDALHETSGASLKPKRTRSK